MPRPPIFRLHPARRRPWPPLAAAVMVPALQAAAMIPEQARSAPAPADPPPVTVLAQGPITATEISSAPHSGTAALQLLFKCGAPGGVNTYRAYRAPWASFGERTRRGWPRGMAKAVR